MSIRWRKTGELLCAAMTEEKEGDTYINDHLHYQLSVISRAIIEDVNHKQTGLWYWVHGDNFLKADPR